MAQDKKNTADECCDGPHEEPEKASTRPRRMRKEKRNGSTRVSDGIKGRKSPREVKHHFQNLVPDRTLSTRDQQLLSLLPNRLKFTLPLSIDHAQYQQIRRRQNEDIKTSCRLPGPIGSQSSPAEYLVVVTRTQTRWTSRLKP